MPRMISVDSPLYNARPVYPANMQYRAALAVRLVPPQATNPERGCNGCLFKGQRAKVCVQAGELARRAGMPDCETRDPETGKTHIYLRVVQDERQGSILPEDIENPG